MSIRIVLAILAVTSTLLPGCGTKPASGLNNFPALLSLEQGAEIGREEHPKIVAVYGVYQEIPALNAYLGQISAHLLDGSQDPARPLTVTLLDDPAANAFAVPGGYIYVNRGMMALANSEAELAGVIGSTIALASPQAWTHRLMMGLLVASAGLAGVDEPDVMQDRARAPLLEEADQQGIRYLTGAGYDPSAMVTVLRQLRRETTLTRTLAYQPDDNAAALGFDERIEAAASSIHDTQAEPREARNAYLSRIDGMIFGNSAERGYISGRIFAHPLRRLTFVVPEGFRIQMGTGTDINTLYAFNAKGAVIRFDADEVSQDQTMTSYLVDTWLKDNPPDDIERIDVNGKEGATASFRQQGESGPVDLRLVAVHWDAQTVYRFLFVSPANLTASLSEPFRSTTYSLRALSASEAAALRPLRLRVIEVGSGDTIASLADRMAFDDLRRERFMVLNGLESDRDLVPGMLVKIVVEG